MIYLLQNVSPATSEGEEDINNCEPQAKRAHVENESLDVAHYVILS